MKIKSKQYAISLYEAVKDLPNEKIKAVLVNFVKILVKNNAMRMAPQIIEYFEKYANRAEGVGAVKIKTAVPMAEEVIENIKKITPELVGRKFKKVNIKKEVDPVVIGGFVLECEDVVFDASLKNKLELLKNNLFIK